MNTTSATCSRSTSMPSTRGGSVGAGVAVAGTSVAGGAGGGGVCRCRNRRMAPTARNAAAPRRARIRGSGRFSGRAFRINSASSAGAYRWAKMAWRAMRARWSSSGGVQPSRFTGITSSRPAFSRKNSSTAGLSAFTASERNSTRASPFRGSSLRTVTPFALRASRMGFTRLSSAGV